MEDRVRVRWSGFGGAVCSWVAALGESSLLADVTVFAGGRSLRAHRLVLAASSALFRDIFEQNPVERPIIVLQDVDFDAFRAILSYIYNGETSVDESFLPTFIKAAEQLRVIGLTFDRPPPATKTETQTESESENVDERRSADVLPVEAVIKEEVESDAEATAKNVPTFAEPPKIKKSKRKRAGKKLRSKHPRLDDSEKCLKKMNKENESLPDMMVPDEVEEAIRLEKSIDEYCAEIENALNGHSSDDQADSCPNIEVNRDEDNRPTFPCPFCGRVYFSWGYRRRHIKTHHESTSLTCKLCFETLGSEVLWFDHVVNVHAVPQSQARDSLVIMVEAHSVLTYSSPPSAISMLHHLQLDNNEDITDGDDSSSVLQEQAVAT